MGGSGRPWRGMEEGTEPEAPLGINLFSRYGPESETPPLCFELVGNGDRILRGMGGPDGGWVARGGRVGAEIGTRADGLRAITLRPWFRVP